MVAQVKRLIASEPSPENTASKPIVKRNDVIFVIAIPNPTNPMSANTICRSKRCQVHFLYPVYTAEPIVLPSSYSFLAYSNVTASERLSTPSMSINAVKVSTLSVRKGIDHTHSTVAIVKSRQV